MNLTFFLYPSWQTSLLSAGPHILLQWGAYRLGHLRGKPRTYDLIKVNCSITHGRRRPDKTHGRVFHYPFSNCDWIFPILREYFSTKTTLLNRYLQSSMSLSNDSTLFKRFFFRISYQTLKWCTWDLRKRKKTKKGTFFLITEKVTEFWAPAKYNIKTNIYKYRQHRLLIMYTHIFRLWVGNRWYREKKNVQFSINKALLLKVNVNINRGDHEETLNVFFWVFESLRRLFLHWIADSYSSPIFLFSSKRERSRLSTTANSCRS